MKTRDFLLIGAGIFFLSTITAKGEVINPTAADIKAALKKIADMYGIDTAKNVEKIFRLETANFTSGGFLKTNAAGMTAFKDSFPYGWNSQKTFWEQSGKPAGTISLKENGTGNTVSFIVFNTVFNAMNSLGYFLKNHVPAQWFSNDSSKQVAYQAKLDGIDSKLVNSFA